MSVHFRIFSPLSSDINRIIDTCLGSWTRAEMHNGKILLFVHLLLLNVHASKTSPRHASKRYQHRSQEGEDVSRGHNSNQDRDEFDYSKGEDDAERRTHNTAEDKELEHDDDDGSFLSNRRKENESAKTSKITERERHRRGHNTRGYKNQFFRDEHHREHRFYDDYHRGGSFEKGGKHRSKFENRVANDFGKLNQRARGRSAGDERGRERNKGSKQPKRLSPNSRRKYGSKSNDFSKSNLFASPT